MIAPSDQWRDSSKSNFKTIARANFDWNIVVLISPVAEPLWLEDAEA